MEIKIYAIYYLCEFDYAHSCSPTYARFVPSFFLFNGRKSDMMCLLEHNSCVGGKTRFFNILENIDTLLTFCCTVLQETIII